MTEYRVTWFTGMKRIRNESRLMPDGSIELGYLDDDDQFHGTVVMTFGDEETRRQARVILATQGLALRIA